jgi:hypothetical protein
LLRTLALLLLLWGIRYSCFQLLQHPLNAVGILQRLQQLERWRPIFGWLCMPA